jgi:hypothetical protein
MKSVFIDAHKVVVQIIVGQLDSASVATFLKSYSSLFGAEECVMVDDSVSVWIGGSYDPTSGEFSPPPSPEPEPEPIVEEPINDDPPII